MKVKAKVTARLSGATDEQKERKSKRRKKKRSERKKRERVEKKEAREANACNGWYDLTCEYPIKMELWAGDVCVESGMETEHQRRLRLGNQYKELSEIVRFSYYAEGFGATRDRYERPKPARIKTNKLQEGKATTTWNYITIYVNSESRKCQTLLTQCSLDHHAGSVQ